MLIYFDAATGGLLYTLKLLDHMTPPPGDFIEVNDMALDLNSFHIVDGQLVERQALSEHQRAVAQEAVTAKRGRCRAAFITDLPGQDMVYLEKRTEAIEFLAYADPTPELFPMIYSEVGITAPTAVQVAQVWLNMNAMWRSVSMLIERSTLKAASLVAQATTKAEIDAALEEMNTALAVLGVD